MHGIGCTTLMKDGAEVEVVAVAEAVVVVEVVVEAVVVVEVVEAVVVVVVVKVVASKIIELANSQPRCVSCFCPIRGIKINILTKVNFTNSCKLQLK
jgi:nitrate/TMAO reductase-like tetraheme cytochrome c subunit